MTIVARSARPLRLRAHDVPHAVFTAEAAQLLGFVSTRELSRSFHEGDQLTTELPNLEPEAIAHLDAEGLAAIGTPVRPGMILVGRLEAARGEKSARDGSLRCPPGVVGVVDFIERRAGAGDEPPSVVVRVRTERALEPGDLVAVGTSSAVVGQVDAALEGVDALWPRLEGEHLVERLSPIATDVCFARSIGPYSLVTNLPLGGREQFGGQELLPSELETLLDLGARHTVHELLTVKADDVAGRVALYETIVRGRPECAPSMPQTTRSIERVLLSLGFDVDFTESEPALHLLTDERIKTLAAGEVKKPETLNYRTLTPEKHGLFCEEIFGARGSHERFVRLGRVELAVPVLHPWAREIAAHLLGVTPAHLRAVVLHEKTLSGAEPQQLGDTGAAAIKAALAKVDLSHPPQGAESLASALRKAGVHPAQLCFTQWLVLPCELRPLVPLEGGRFATSDLNDLYRRLINRNNRTRRLIELNAPEIILRNEARMLQEALDALVENGLEGREAIVGPNDRPLVPLLGLLTGERGLFRRAGQKRVDYSGVARAVPLSTLAGRRALLSRNMALELFKPWLYERLEAAGHVTRIKEAKRLVEQRDARALAALEEVVAQHPLLVFNEFPPAQPAALGVELALWDAPAIALSPEALRHLGVNTGGLVVVHVPIDPRAVDEVRALTFERQRATAAAARESWLAKAAMLDHPASSLMQAALHGEVEGAHSRLGQVLLGRLVAS